MNHNTKIPTGAEIVQTYAQYNQHVNAFFAGRYQLLIVVGRPGLSKSFAFEAKLGSTSYLIRGWAAPLQAYIEAYRHRNQQLVFDDAETLWKRPGGRVLLRSLCEHKPKKVVQWTSTARDLIQAGVPQSFVTTSKVAIIANRFVFGEAEEYEAVMDRGHVLVFDPSPVEVHAQVANWFWDQQIYDHVGERLHLLEHNSARLYLKAWERKNAGGDWRKLIEVAYCRDSTIRIVQALEADPTCKTVADRVRKFVEQTGACRATYFNLKKELKNNDQLPHLEKLHAPLRQLHNDPPQEPEIEESTETLQGDTDEALGPMNGNLDTSSEPNGNQHPNSSDDQNLRGYNPN